MNFRVAQPSILVDLNKIPELGYIKKQNGETRIGAMTRQATVERSPEIKGFDPLLHAIMPFIAHPQIRNRGTFGGSLAHADPAAELPVYAIARDIRFKAQSQSGERWIAAKDFYKGLFSVDLRPDEILVEIGIPAFPKNTGWSFTEVARRHGDYAMAGVIALVALKDDGTCQSARLVYLNVGDGPMDAVEAAGTLVGTKISTKKIQDAASLASEKEITPFGNVHATPEYQTHLSKVLTERAIAEALDRAKAAIKD
jgi:carbon-monoxide dehydrogenase medium subunit